MWQRTRVILPNSGMLRQTDLRWVSEWQARPNPVNLGNIDGYDFTRADRAAPDGPVHVLADSSQVTTVDLREERTWEPLVTFWPPTAAGNRLNGSVGSIYNRPVHLTMRRGALKARAIP